MIYLGKLDENSKSENRLEIFNRSSHDFQYRVDEMDLKREDGLYNLSNLNYLSCTRYPVLLNKYCF